MKEEEREREKIRGGYGRQRGSIVALFSVSLFWAAKGKKNNRREKRLKGGR